MKNIKFSDLNSLSVNQIESCINELNNLKERKNKTIEFVRKVKAEAEANNLCIDDIVAILMNDKNNRKNKNPAKYELTIDGKLFQWSGIGKAPKWFVDYKNKNGDIEAIRIKS